MNADADADARGRVIRTEADRLAEVLAGADPAARVPTCPEWTATELLAHLTEVHRFWGMLLAADATTDTDMEAVEAGKPPMPEDLPGLLRLREQVTGELVEQLRRHPEDGAALWSWWDADRSVGFTRRMQTYEATMHRIDAELAAGLEVSPIAVEVAVGAVDQCVDVMWGWMPDWATYEPLATVELRAADASRRWSVEIGHWCGTGPESGKTFDMVRTRRAAPGSAGATVSGAASDLARWAWGRAPGPGTVMLEGEQSARAAIDRLIAQGIQ